MNGNREQWLQYSGEVCISMFNISDDEIFRIISLIVVIVVESALSALSGRRKPR